MKQQTMRSLEESGWTLLALSVISVMPLWLVEFLPIIDLPQHLGQVTALREYLQGNPLFVATFEPNWFTPYMIGNLLMYGLSSLMPMLVAAKLMVSVALVAVPWSIRLMLGAAGGDRRLAILAIPCAFSTAYYWGFLPFLIGIPLVFLALASAIRFDRDPDLRNGLTLAALMLVLFPTHMLALGAAGFLCGLYVLAARFGDWSGMALRMLPLMTPLPLMVAWSLGFGDAVDAPVTFVDFASKLKEAVSQSVGKEVWSVGALLLFFGVTLVPVLAGCRPTRQAARYLPFVGALVLFFGLPFYAGGTGFFHTRMGVFLLPCWLLVWERQERARPYLSAAVCVTLLASSAANSLTYSGFANETRTFRTVLDMATPGERLGMIPVDRSSLWFGTPVYWHFGAWYQALKGGVVDFGHGDGYGFLMRYRQPLQPAISDAVGYDPRLFDWETHGGDRYRYFLVASWDDVSQPLFKEHREKLRLVGRDGKWWLYENTEK